MFVPPRHTLVWPDPGGRRHLRRHAPAPVADWTDADRPLVLRRRAPGDPPGSWPLALALPPAGTRLARFAVTLPVEAAARHAPPPTLDAALDAGTFPPDWHSRIRAVLALGRRHGIMPRVFGGALWQYLSGLPYLHPRSDLDLLWFPDPSGALSLPVLLLGLSTLPDVPPRLDGEILFPDGSGVQWRELAAAGPDTTVLLKTAEAVRLVPAAILLVPNRNATA